MKEEEVWKDIEGYEGLYQVSNIGNVKSIVYKTHRIFTKRISNGYYNVALFKNKNKKQCSIHRLVAIAFIKNTQNLPQVNHINGIKTDNRVENLEWVTPKENILHAHKLGIANQSGERNVRSKLTNEQVVEIFLDNRKNVEISKSFKVSEATISRIKLKTNWSKITNNIK